MIPDNSTPVSRMLHEDEAELNRLAEFAYLGKTVPGWIRTIALVQRDRNELTVAAFQQWMQLADQLDLLEGK